MNLQGSIIGIAGQGVFGAVSTFLPEAIRRAKPGVIIPYADNYWGGGEVMLVKATGTIAAFETCTLIPVFTASEAFQDGSTGPSWVMSATAVPVTANLGQPVGIALAPMTVGQYGWVAISAAAMPAANSILGVVGTMFISGTAGRLFTTATAGRQILNFRCLSAALTTVRPITGGVPGGFEIQLNNVDGIHVGGTCSGTGVGTNALVTSVRPDNRTINVSVANTSTALAGNLTFTNNAAGAAPFFPVCTFQRPFAQGQIT
jgi:hypothetical protein